MIKDLAEDFCIHTNEYNTDITKELLLSLPEEVAEQLLDIIDNVQYVKNLISPNRRKAKDMPHDDLGRVIVDHENPHILEDMSYFTKAADHFRKHGCYTFLKPNPNPNSDYKKWIEEEKRRCLEGLVRPSDGEWITGFMYWYMNYCPIMLTKISEGSKKADRVEDFPEMWEGIYLRYHYQHIARMNGHHGIELARRGCSKSFSLASMMAHNFVLGENPEAKKRVTTVLTAYQKEFLADKDGTLSKFEPMINFVAENTEFPRLRLRSSSQDMFWQAGYLDSYGIKKGSLNTVIGVSSKDDSGKLRGKRGHIYFEEMGSFPNLLEIYDIVRQGMEEGDYTYGFAYLVGTSGEKESNFESAKTLLYNPESYNIQAIKNIYDKPKQGRSSFGYFFPAFVNRKGCYNKDGVSDVVKALIQILMARYNAKKSSDPSSLLRITAEMPITPAEAIIKVRTSYFPITEISERLLQLDTDPRAFDDVYVGELYEKNGGIAFRVSDAVPIRQYKVDNTTKGALEIYEMPVRNNGEVQEGRYIIGHDPVDNDQANSDSLSSTLVLDLFTDKIVAEYTGRQPYADENYEIVRKLCLFYNAKCLFESNKKGIFAYFKTLKCVHLLADTPSFLREKQLVKYSAFGSNSKGVNANRAINEYADSRIRDWLMKPVVIHTEGKEGLEEKETYNLYFIRSRALLQELAAYNATDNFDRIRALGMLMLYRQERLGSLEALKTNNKSGSYTKNDDFFDRNYISFYN